MVLFAGFGATAQAADSNKMAIVGVQGYDLVSYHTGEPVRGNGHHTVVHQGVTYMFASEENQKTFKKNPKAYLPAYGGYCAYGVSVGKKFMVDPLAWRIVDGTLYLNLDADVQKIWQRDVMGNISIADQKWPGIKDVPAGKL